MAEPLYYMSTDALYTDCNGRTSLLHVYRCIIHQIAMAEPLYYMSTDALYTRLQWQNLFITCPQLHCTPDCNGRTSLLHVYRCIIHQIAMAEPLYYKSTDALFTRLQWQNLFITCLQTHYTPDCNGRTSLLHVLRPIIHQTAMTEPLYYMSSDALYTRLQ